MAMKGFCFDKCFQWLSGSFHLGEEKIRVSSCSGPTRVNAQLTSVLIGVR